MDYLNAKAPKHRNLAIEQSDEMLLIAKALSSPARLEIIKLLSKHSLLSVNEIAQKIQLPVSSTALYIQQLEDANLIITENHPGVRGSLKLSSLKIDSINFILNHEKTVDESVLAIHMPISSYNIAGNIKPTCGLASIYSNIGIEDNPASLYHSERFDAQIIWFREGFVEYHFSVMNINNMDIRWIELSFEACSEAPQYRNPWKSDIYVYINNQPLGFWTSPCDCGGRRGNLNPDWWPDLKTQYGFLKTWRVNSDGSFLDNFKSSSTTLDRLKLLESDHIKVRIEVPATAKNVGGINLFGDKFGDYPQGIAMRIGYQVKED